jgi:apolipoprotein N-acyltransferase
MMKCFYALSAGILYALAFAPFNASYLLFLALLLLFYTWQGATAKQAAGYGYLFGLGQFGLGVSWVYVSIHDFGKAGVLSAGIMTVLFVSFWAIFPALTGYISTLSSMRINSLLHWAIIWTGIEYLRGVFVLSGFPWLLTAYSQLDTPLAGYIAIVGVYGTGFLAALTAILLLSLRQQKNWRVAGFLISLWAMGAYLQTVQWTQPIGAPIPVALIQGNVSQDQKWLPENKINTLRLYKTLTEQNWDAKIIVWPETAIPAYLYEVKEHFLLPLQQLAQQQHSDLIVGLPIKETDGKKYNAAMTLGNQMADYRKQHLLPFGETMPWQPLSGFVLRQLGLNLGDFTAGADNQTLLQAGGYSFSTSICYEDVFAELAIQGLAEAAFLVNVTNDAWFGNTIEPHQHNQIARMRALETGRYLLRATNTGLTTIIAPTGKIVQQLPLFEVDVLRGHIIPMGGLTPYARLGDMPVLIFLAGMLIVLWVKKWEKL